MDLWKQFNEFDRDNPGVWELFKRFTLQVINAGHAHYSADCVLHRIRWHTSVDTGRGEDFRINNNYAAGYARKFETEFPRHRGFFRLRASKLDVPAELPLFRHAS